MYVLKYSLKHTLKYTLSINILSLRIHRYLYIYTHKRQIRESANVQFLL